MKIYINGARQDIKYNAGKESGMLLESPYLHDRVDIQTNTDKALPPKSVLKVIHQKYTNKFVHGTL